MLFPRVASIQEVEMKFENIHVRFSEGRTT